MKSDRIKFSIFCLVVFAIVCLPLSKPVFKEYSNISNCQYTFYVSGSVDKINNATVTKNGNASVVSCSAEFSGNIKNQLSDILGESVCFYKPSQKTANYILDMLTSKILFSENVQENKICYAYDETLPRFVMVNNQKVNLQIAINDNFIKIGYPLILDSF